MSESMRPYDGADRTPYRTGGPQSPASLADVLERVLDKGVVIAGDIQIRLLDIELLTIKIRLLIASVDKAREMGINWWENDPFVSTQLEDDQEAPRELQERVEALESRLQQTQESEQSGR
ncbi:MAG: gas vesicle protein [Nocardioides sp.]